MFEFHPGDVDHVEPYDIIDYLSIPREYILEYIHITDKRIGP